ncbi:BTAD domain-containing putative transcriptional regulator [Microbispora sp. NPDC046933]|uniref:BTAD domain-containing putative transcriptional regulator n=1 Tax=Microbispora sp. NPDC046933 TaxID=3155618 RepID=UPI0033D1DE51
MAEAFGTVRYSLLGPLRAWRDGQELDLGWARQQAVLAVLLLEMNRPVSVSAIVDAVWGNDPPRNARSTVQTYVSRLRRVLQPGRTANARNAVLLSTDAGYQVRGDPTELDVAIFERRLAAAQDHRARGDHEAAAAEVDAALALWRGEPFGGLEGPRLEAERRRLSERHAFARELRAAIRLELGQNTAAIAELTRLIGEFPLQERLRGLLMLALYRAGRQADALAAYQDVRRLLAEELGIDPGPELRDLHERILRNERELAGPAPAMWRHPAGGPRDGAGRAHPEGHRLDRAARELALAVAQQWRAEAAARSLFRPKPVRLRWSSTGRPVAATASAVLDDDGEPGRAERVDLHGDLDGLVEAFRLLPARQLVILGEPGAGKTVLAILLTLGLLDAPEPGEPAPVLLPLSSWNPRRDHLHTWLVRKLVEEYPGLANTAAYGPDAPARLVATGRVMPVLDGLDETPPGLHAVAIDALDEAIAGGRPLVVTCRSTEYEKAVQHGGAILARAAVVEIEPVGIEDAVAYLTARRRLGEDRWDPVVAHLRAHPEGPLACALSTPLMVDLTRTAYADPTGDPAELLDAARFPGQAEIEEHLLDAFVPAAYRHHPPAPGTRPPPPPRYRPAQAGRWLTFLARHLRHGHTHDLAWWQLADAMPRRTRGLVFGLPPALLCGLTGGLAAGPVIGLVYGLSFAVAGVIAHGRGRRTGPVRVEVRFRGTAKRFLGRFAIGLTIGVALGLGWALPVLLTLMLCVVFGLATGSHVWLDAPADATRASSPPAMLRQDRVATLSFTLSTALALGLFYATAYTFSRDIRAIPVLGGVFDLELAVPAGLAAALLGRSLFGRLGSVTYGLAGAVIGGQVMTPTSTFASGLAVGGVFGLAVGLTVASSRAWGAFAVTRAWLALSGRAPLRLIRFLDDAHRRGVLRQTGAVYQFRHARLRDHLANRNAESPDPSG